MPIRVNLPDGRVVHFPDGMAHQQIEAEVSKLAGPPEPVPPQEQGSGGASATIGALRAGPAAGRGLARFAANHPAATQKVIGAGISTAAGGAGAAVGGVPGAVVGASIRGVTPAQSVIRETAGRLAGESPEIAKGAGRAMGVVNYAKETAGLRMKPTDLISSGNPTAALDSYAESMGQKVPRVLDQYGKVVFGPEAARAASKPSIGGRLMTSAAKGAGVVGKALGTIAGPQGLLDLAQTAEPNRRDIGFLGIGGSQPTPQGAELEQLNQRNIAAISARDAEQQAQQAQVRQRILSLFGLQ